MELFKAPGGSPGLGLGYTKGMPWERLGTYLNHPMGALWAPHRVGAKEAMHLACANIFSIRHSQISSAFNQSREKKGTGETLRRNKEPTY